ncbi:MAG: c-type cytochrome [Acidobacteriota bacterium]
MVSLGLAALLPGLAGCGGGEKEPDEVILYAGTCAGCHGPTGQADGPASPFVYPRPRDFTRSPFKFGGTPQEIARTITRGLPGTSMPPFGDLLSASEVASLAAHVSKLSPFSSPGGEIVAVPSGAGSAMAGKTLFADTCAKCHGPTGRGDGPSARTMTDQVGIPLRPIDLTSAPLKGGETGEDLYLRISRGIPGTPMPSYEGALTAQQTWDLVAYIQSLRPAHAATPPAGGIIVRRVTRLPEPTDPAGWREAPAATLGLRPLWQRPQWPPSLTVRAVHDGRTMRFLLEWPDARPDRTVGRMEDFVDAVGLMLPAEGDMRPFIGMGRASAGEDRGATVRIWQWRATQGIGPASAYPRLVRDTNPLEALPQARPASLAGNPLSGGPGRSPEVPAVVEYVAAGPGTLTVVPAAQREGTGSGAWEDGRWRVMVDLESRPDGTSRLGPGTRTLVAFAVWDGSAGDRNGQKTITAWVNLEVEE